MKLPDKPSLEHLKKQAKDLLKNYRAEKAESLERIQKHIKDFSTDKFLLSHAQTVIAREYSFSSWAKLKQHVENIKTKRPKVSARKTFIQDLVNQLLTFSEHHEVEELGQRFAIMPLRDIVAVRDDLVKNNQLSLLVDGLLEGLNHVKPRVRYNCALALDHLADERCTKPLMTLLSDPVARVRRAALHSLSCDACKIMPLADRKNLVNILTDLAFHDPSIRVRREAAYSLGELGDPKTIPVLEKLQGDEDAAIQRTTRSALKRFKNWN